MTHRSIVAVAFFFALAGASCSDADEKGDDGCPDGVVEVVDDVNYCVVTDAEAGCPETYAEPVFEGDVVVCAAEEQVLDESVRTAISASFGPARCSAPWKELELDGVTYCVLESFEVGVEHLCPTTQPKQLENGQADLVGCVPEDAEGSIDRVRAYYAEVCAAAASSEETCRANHGCRFVGEEDHVRIVENACVFEGTGNVCLYVFGEQGNAEDCSYRTNDGVQEAIWTNSIFLSVGWAANGTSNPSGNACRCFVN